MITTKDVLVALTRGALLSLLLATLVSPTARQPTTCDGATPSEAVWLPPTCAFHLENE